VVEIGALRLHVLDTPGHWRGDISLHEPEARAVFTGDSLHRGEIGRRNAGCDEDRLRASIETRLMVLPDDTVVYSGHGPATTIGEEREHNRGLRGLPPEPRKT
jgi:glyoxylase-like metal-dependent hydrolase (beta-lactamase superfamily II)